MKSNLIIVQEDMALSTKTELCSYSSITLDLMNRDVLTCYSLAVATRARPPFPFYWISEFTIAPVCRNQILIDEVK